MELNPPLALHRPLLLLDVDGPLNPWRLITKKGHLPVKTRHGEEAYAYDRHVMHVGEWEDPTGPPLPVLLSPEHGAELRQLSNVFTLVWATTWVEDANTFLAPLLGIPDLPVIGWPAGLTSLGRTSYRQSWKTPHILAWLDEHARRPDGRVLPWAWVDDEVSRRDRDRVREHYRDVKGEPASVPNLLLRIEPSHGLRRGDFTTLAAFAAAHQLPAPTPA